MGNIEKKEPMSAAEIVEHMKQEVHMNARKMLARNKELKNEIPQRPGSEIYLLDLERMKEDILRIGNITETERK